ncbi:venom acid phosphatase Acph-1-like isoform X1 [Ooceraea biroi]|uniref:venom acid phosphatase Acph-1-like isoform X1 n=2 Tax=Ooceraea biroi TaxID=2015173 RepID=UPI000F08D956|nr:venom acid phosphatase Acph-1-like isoform X1 [Ooceraea biroi]
MNCQYRSSEGKGTLKMNGLRSFALITLASCVWIIPSLAAPELKLVHVLFAHKLYAPEENDADYAKQNETSIPQTLSYEYFTSAAMSMPKEAHLNMYNLGVHLREIYNEFLGDMFMLDVMKTRTTEYALSILSAQLVNAGLWPPSEEQMWMEDFNWQPIPTDYLELKEDTLMLGTLCPNFLSQMDQMLQTIEVQKIIAQHQSLFDYLSQYTKRNISTPSEVALLYATLETMVDRNELLPNWAIDIFPDGAMYNVTLLEYDLLSANSLQRQLNGGTLLGEIIGNSLKYKAGDIPKERKILLYSGDQRNIIGVLKNLDSWSPHIPNEAAALIFELYFDNETKIYGMKINYYTGVGGITIPLLLPNCTEICPLQSLVDIAFISMPENPQSLCGWPIKHSIEIEDQFNSTHSNISASYHTKNLIVSLILLFFNILL